MSRPLPDHIDHDRTLVLPADADLGTVVSDVVGIGGSTFRAVGPVEIDPRPSTATPGDPSRTAH